MAECKNESLLLLKKQQGFIKALDASNTEIRKEIEKVSHTALGGIFHVQALQMQKSGAARLALISYLKAATHDIKAENLPNAHTCLDGVSGIYDMALSYAPGGKWHPEDLQSFNEALSALRDHPDEFSNSEIEAFRQKRDKVMDQLKEEEDPSDAAP